MKLLHIISSPRGENSRTLSVSHEFLNELKAKYPNLTIDELDLFKTTLPDVFDEAATAKYTILGGGSLNEKTKNVWDQITEFSGKFLSYNIYLISSPMWNFTVPYVLKHYIDVIMQPGYLFNFTESGVVGLATNKKMFCITSRGNDYSAGGPMHPYDFQEPYLRSIFGLAGIYDISFINVQPVDIAPQLTEAALGKAKEDAKLLARNTVL